MYVAVKKREENISEYLLYMFRVEDLVRALGGDEEAISAFVQRSYTDPTADHVAITAWYMEIAYALRDNEAWEVGHTAEIEELILYLYDLHLRLLKAPSQEVYKVLYYDTLPSIVQLRSLNPDSPIVNEIETCFVGVYGYLTLRMKEKEVHTETLASIKQISTFLAMLADRYCEEEAGNLPMDTAGDAE